MRLLNIISSVNPLGGGPIEGVKSIGLELIKLGHSQDVLSLDRDEDSFVTDFPLRLITIGNGKTGYRYNNKLVDWLKNNHHKYDAIIVEGLWQYHSFAVWRAVANTNTPYFVFTHGMLDPWFKKTFPLKHLKKWLYWPWAEYRVLRDATATIFTCEEELKQARKSFWLYKCKEAIVSYGTSAPPSDETRLKSLFFAAYPGLKDKRIFLYLSRIHVKKGCDLLIDAFAEACGTDPALHLVMAGPDQQNWAAALKKRAEELHIADRITWTGMLQGDQKWGAFYAAEVFCLPSHQENFGIVVAEALACGKPVIISNKVNIWREIESSSAGIVRDDTLSGTIDGLMSWIKLSEQQQMAMKKSARACFENNFQISKVAKNLISVISQHGK